MAPQRKAKLSVHKAKLNVHNGNVMNNKFLKKSEIRIYSLLLVSGVVVAVPGRVAARRL